MRSTHYAPKPLPDFGTNSQAYWARNPSGTLVVFVHGLRGHATKTWVHFPRLLTGGTGKAAQCDFLFYGYDSLTPCAVVNANLLRDRLNGIHNDPTAVINHTLPLAPRRNFHYTKTIIVAHSLGSIVARRALLDGYTLHHKWVDHTRLLFFAPAHMGSDSLGILSETFCGGFGRVFVAVLQTRYCSLRDLQYDSPTIDKLKQDAQDVVNRHGSVPDWLRASVYHAEFDRWVSPSAFPTDGPSTTIPGKRHSYIQMPSTAACACYTYLLREL